jgi:hypothetical protein
LESARQVPTEEAKAYANEAGLLFFETSAKKGDGVRDVFTEIGTNAFSKFINILRKALINKFMNYFTAKKIPLELMMSPRPRNQIVNGGPSVVGREVGSGGPNPGTNGGCSC